MTQRPFAYNPSQIEPIGTTQWFDLVIGVTAQAYCNDIGGVKWWGGPDEDLGWVICAPVPLENWSTPVGNIGSVKFWRTPELSDASMLALVNRLSGGIITSMNDVMTWILNQAYWTNWPGASAGFYNGLEYNHYAVSYNVNGASIAPAGWRVPTGNDVGTDFDTLLGGTDINWQAFNAETFKSTTGWSANNGTNSTGFNALPAGYRSSIGAFVQRTETALFWALDAWDGSRYMMLEFTNLDQISVMVGGYPYLGAAVRLIKNDDVDPGTMTDYDGNIYPTVKIGNQVWMASNLKVIHFNDGTLIPEITDNTAWVNTIDAALCAYNNDWAQAGFA